MSIPEVILAKPRRCTDKHKLIVIFRGNISCDAESVIRWCTNCGGIVIDRDFDGRTSPGFIMKMMFPVLPYA